MSFSIKGRIAFMPIFIMSAGLLHSVATNAASVSATTQLFERTTAPGSAELIFSNDFYVQSAETSLGSNNFAADIEAQEIISNGNNAQGTTTAQSTWAELSMPSTSAGVIQNGTASSLFQWSFDWQSISTGQAKVDFDYLFNITSINFLAGESAGVSARINALVDNQPTTEVEHFYFFNDQNGQADDLEKISLLFDVTAGQIGSITLTLASQGFAEPAPVPLPAAFWMFGSALAGLLGLRRKQKFTA